MQCFWTPYYTSRKLIWWKVNNIIHDIIAGSMFANLSWCQTAPSSSLFFPLVWPCSVKPFPLPLIFFIFPLFWRIKMVQIRTISDRFFGISRKVTTDWTRKWTKKGLSQIEFQNRLAPCKNVIISITQYNSQVP